MEELRLFALKGMADELEKPAKDKESGGKHPERMIENGGDPERKRHHDQRNAKAMAEPVYRMCMAARVLRDPLFAAASTKHGGIINPALLLRRQQKDPRGPGMYVAVRRNFLMFADIGALQAESDDLAFVVNGKCAYQHHVAWKIPNRFVQIDHSIFAGPKESTRSHGACNFAHYLAGVIDVEGFTVNCAGLSAQGLNSGSAGPDESANASAALGSPDDRSAVINMVSVAAGIARKNAKVLHCAVLP